jgi:hypothetical protein
MRFAFADKLLRTQLLFIPAGINNKQDKTSWVVDNNKDYLLLFLHQENKSDPPCDCFVLGGPVHPLLLLRADRSI